MVLIERAKNKTNDNTMPDKNILAILYEEISKDPREALQITALNYRLFHLLFQLRPLNCALLIESVSWDLYRHDINRLYLAMTICISNEIQFLCPVAIATTCGMTL